MLALFVEKRIKYLYHKQILGLFFLVICDPICQNGGMCKNSGRCKCPKGFKGTHCQLVRKKRKRKNG